MKLLGKAMAAVACVMDPEVFVVGGGLSKAGSIIIDTAAKYYKEYAFHASVRQRSSLPHSATQQACMAE